jgi:methionyl-tRNA formyltransferase
MRLVLFVSGAFAVPTMRRLAAEPHELVAAVSQPSRPRGRGRRAQPTPAAEWAARLGIEVIESANVNEPAFVERVAAMRADLGVVIAFGQKLGAALCGAIRSGCVNLHGSLLPRYRGASPIAWAILNGEAKTGVTVFRLTDRIDAGEILVRRETLIGEAETAGELHDRLAMIGPDAMTAALALFEAEPDPRGEAQDQGDVSIAPKLTKESGLLDFRHGAAMLERQVRAMTPWPGARCAYRSADGARTEPIAVCAVRAIVDAEASGAEEAGLITPLYEVQTGHGRLEVVGVKPAGGRVMTWQDFVNGRHVRPGDRLVFLETG